ncbi:MAG: type II 3-dehydroquinate dehydratase [Coriobacteriia bacterium]|nr:type II 3-dehydroquinate dehydratase [Coriobacteriia bacterium]
MKFLLVHGPNLDMLGIREPDIYGTDTLEGIQQRVCAYAAGKGVEMDCFQSNHEGALIDCIHAAHAAYDGVVYNPGAHTHYSYALRDAVGSISTPVVEVHLSAVDQREPFRAISVVAPACVAQVKGLGVEGYERAVDILLEGHTARLGEGFEARYPAGNVIVARHE